MAAAAVAAVLADAVVATVILSAALMFAEAAAMST